MPLKINRRLGGWLTLIVALLLMVSLGVYKVTHTPPKPLYWVSQMDPNFRSPLPGKCPHGMDLIPVYEEPQRDDKAMGQVDITPEVQQQLAVRKTKVILGNLTQQLPTFGRILANPALLEPIIPRSKGWIERLYVVSAGEPVSLGQPLYAFYSPELITAQVNYLSALKSPNQSQHAMQEDQLRLLGMDDQAIEQLNKERAVQRNVIMRAPKDGVVDMLRVQKNVYVKPKDTLMMIGSMESVWVELEVFESQAVVIKPRQTVSLTTPAYPNLVWTLEVDYIYPDLMPKSKNLKLRAKLDNTQMLLRPNMFVQGTIRLPDEAVALLIPRQAVIHQGDEARVVQEFEPGKFKSVKVKLGKSNDQQIQVLQGLNEGDTLVASAQFLIDAESNKTSDGLRMDPYSTTKMQYPATWVNAVIKDINLSENILKLKHETISAWKMPAMTMNFKAAESLNLTGLSMGDRVAVKIMDGDPLFNIVDLKLLKASSAQ